MAGLLLLPRGCLGGQCPHALWSRYDPRRALGCGGFPVVQAQKEKLRGLSEMLAAWASCFYHSVLPSVLLASKIMQETNKQTKGRAVVWGSWDAIVCLFVYLFIIFFPFDCFVFSLFQTAGSVPFIRLIDDGWCGITENRTWLNSWMLPCLFTVLMSREGMTVSSSASVGVVLFLGSGLHTRPVHHPYGTPGERISQGFGLGSWCGLCHHM